MANVDPLRATIYQFPMVETDKGGQGQTGALVGAAEWPRGASGPTEEAGATPVGTAASEIKESGPRAFLQAARRNLTEEEAASPAGVRWLAHDADRWEQDCVAARKELADLRKKHDDLTTQYHDKRIEVEALKGARNVSIRNEILSTLCIIGGSSGLSVFPSYLATPATANLAYVGLPVSGVLLLGGLILRIWK